jgi:hypothetical protein
LSLYVNVKSSSLNHHLFQSHLSDSSQCACGDAIENNFHYLYVCPLFIRHRIQLFNSLRKFQDVLNLDILLKGSPILTVDENTEIFDAVHHFITGSRRFTWFNRFSFVSGHITLKSLPIYTCSSKSLNFSA